MLSFRSLHRYAPKASLVGTTTRSVSTASRRTYPQYTVYGSNCLLSLKMVLPTFRATRNSIYVDGSKGLGRLILEWTPRDPNGAYCIVSVPLA